MIVYRLEGPLRDVDPKSPRGIFSAGVLNIALDELAKKRGVNRWHMQDSPYQHPEPSEDILGWTTEHYCGFKDLEQMKMWFADPWLRDILNSMECSLAIYEVEEQHVLLGNAQVMFIKKFSTVISRSPIPLE